MLIDEEKERSRVKIGGILEQVKKVYTRKTNSEMAFFTLSDQSGARVDCIIFPKTYEIYKKHLIADSILIVEGEVDTKNDKATILVDKIFFVDKTVLDLPSN